jgi:hypothetical protein
MAKQGNPARGGKFRDSLARQTQRLSNTLSKTKVGVDSATLQTQKKVLGRINGDMGRSSKSGIGRVGGTMKVSSARSGRM